MTIISFPYSLEDIDSLDIKNIPKEDLTLEFDSNLFDSARKTLFYESSLAHWIISIWSFANTNKLKILFDNSDLSIEQIASSMPGCLLVLLATSGKIEGLSRQESANFRKRLFSIQQTWPDLNLSDSQFLICSDSYSSGLPKQLYPDSTIKKIIDPEGFEYVLAKMIQAVAPEEFIKGAIVKRSNAISLILHELFKNTHDHARKTYDGGIVSESIRVLYCRFYSSKQLIENENLKSKKTSRTNVVEQFASSLMDSNKRPIFSVEKMGLINGLLEISILDSGSGLAAVWGHADVNQLDPQTQFEYILECFKKGQSSIPSSERGYGLWKVLYTLRELKGFIKIRTNAVHALRQFSTLEYRAIEKVNKNEIPLEKMYDWRRGSSEKLSNYSPIQGTLISVLIPLGDL